MGYLGNKPADSYLTLEKQTFTTSATDTYTLDREVSSVNDIELFLNNVRQEPTEAYTISGTTLTLASAITSSDSMYCIYQGRAVGTQSPAVGSVTNDMLSGSIANDKLANSSITLNGSAVSLGGSATIVGNIGCVQRASGGTTVSNTTTTKLPYKTTLVDNGNNFDTGNDRFTAPVTGIYEVNAWNQHGGMSGYVTYYIYVNGTAQYEYVNEHGNHYGYPSSGISASTYLTANDYIEIYVQHNAGSNLLFYSDRWSQFAVTLTMKV